MLLTIHPKNPDERKIAQVVNTLRNGGVIIYPTDTVYGIGCDINRRDAVEKICRIKNIKPDRAQLSFLCDDLSNLSMYAKSIDTPLYRFLKQHIPGPYTFILEASKLTPKILKTKKDTVGIRVPDNNIALSIIKQLGNPILSTSLPVPEESYIYTDAEEIYDKYENTVDIVIDGGRGGYIPSTILDCTQFPPEIIREGLGKVE